MDPKTALTLILGGIILGGILILVYALNKRYSEDLKNEKLRNKHLN